MWCRGSIAAHEWPHLNALHQLVALQASKGPSINDVIRTSQFIDPCPLLMRRISSQIFHFGSPIPVDNSYGWPHKGRGVLLYLRTHTYILLHCPPLSFLYFWLLRVDCSLRRKWVIVLFALCTYSLAPLSSDGASLYKASLLRGGIQKLRWQDWILYWPSPTLIWLF